MYNVIAFLSMFIITIALTATKAFADCPPEEQAIYISTDAQGNRIVNRVCVGSFREAPLAHTDDQGVLRFNEDEADDRIEANYEDVLRQTAFNGRCYEITNVESKRKCYGFYEQIIQVNSAAGTCANLQNSELRRRCQLRREQGEIAQRLKPNVHQTAQAGRCYTLTNRQEQNRCYTIWASLPQNSNNAFAQRFLNIHNGGRKVDTTPPAAPVIRQGTPGNGEAT